jgi:hypothetical protein
MTHLLVYKVVVLTEARETKTFEEEESTTSGITPLMKHKQNMLQCKMLQFSMNDSTWFHSVRK